MHHFAFRWYFLCDMSHHSMHITCENGNYMKGALTLTFIFVEPGDFDIQGGTRNRTHRHIHFDSWSLCISVWITRYSESLSQVIMKRSDSIHFMDYNMGLSITDEWMRWEISIMWIERSKGRKRDGEGEGEGNEKRQFNWDSPD